MFIRLVIIYIEYGLELVKLIYLFGKDIILKRFL